MGSVRQRRHVRRCSWSLHPTDRESGAHAEGNISLPIKECPAFVFILASLVKDACRYLSRSRPQTGHVEGASDLQAFELPLALHTGSHWRRNREADDELERCAHTRQTEGDVPLSFFF